MSRLRQHQHLPARLQELLAQMQRRRISIAHADNHDTPGAHQRLNRLGELLDIKGVNPLGQVGHLLFIVARQQRVALHRIAIIGQRHSALAQGAQLIAHIFIFFIAQALEQTADRGFRYAAQLRQLGAVVANQVIKMIENKIRHPLLLGR